MLLSFSDTGVGGLSSVSDGPTLARVVNLAPGKTTELKIALPRQAPFRAVAVGAPTVYHSVPTGEFTVAEFAHGPLMGEQYSQPTYREVPAGDELHQAENRRLFARCLMQTPKQSGIAFMKHAVKGDPPILTVACRTAQNQSFHAVFSIVPKRRQCPLWKPFR